MFTNNWQINVREYRRGNQNGQSRETDDIGNTRRRQTKQKHSTIFVGHHCTQTNTNNVNKTWTLLQTTGGKDEPNKHNNVNKTWTLLQTTGDKNEQLTSLIFALSFPKQCCISALQNTGELESCSRSLFFSKSTKTSLMFKKGVWHSPNTLPSTIQDSEFRIKTM
jgi:hypothetical protein